MRKRIAGWIIAKAMGRPADIVIGGESDPYLSRWYVIPRNRFLNVYVHRFHRSDDDRALHDHPWHSLSWLMRGYLVEVTHVADLGAVQVGDLLDENSITYRAAKFRHRLIVPSHVAGSVWTLFVTGPRVREWGFWCPRGFVHWRDFTAGPKGETVGRGCE